MPNKQCQSTTGTSTISISGPFFHANLGHPVSTGSKRKPLRISGVEFFYSMDFLPVNQASVSKHWREHKALTLTSRLGSSFLHPPPDSWHKGCCSLYSGSPTPVLPVRTTTTQPQPFYSPFSGTTQVSRCQKRTSGLYGARKDCWYVITKYAESTYSSANTIIS